MLHDKASNHITGLSDRELAEYIRGGAELVSAEALEVARLELARRNVPPEIAQVGAEDPVLQTFEATKSLRQPDWNSQSDPAFLAAAKATFDRHAPVLRRLA